MGLQRRLSGYTDRLEELDELPVRYETYENVSGMPSPSGFGSAPHGENVSVSAYVNPISSVRVSATEISY